MEGGIWGVTYKECRAEGDVQSAMLSLPMCAIGHVRMCMCVCVCVEKKKTLLIGGKSLTDTPQGNGRR